MKKIVAIIAGDPDSINSEIIAKTWKKRNISKNLNMFIIRNKNLIRKKFKILKIKINIKKLKSFRKMILKRVCWFIMYHLNSKMLSKIQPMEKGNIFLNF